MTQGSSSREPQSLLVTGGSGFIGSSFIRYLLGPAGYRGRILNLDLLTYAGNPENLAGVEKNERYRFVRGDIGNAEFVGHLVAEHAVDTIVHFAA